MTQIPVFLHIPKNAGTYVLGWCFNLVRMQGILTKKNSQLGWNIALRLILVKKDGQTIFTVVGYDPDHLKNSKFIINNDNRYISEIDIDLFLNEMHKIEISSIHIESYGFKFLKTDFFKILFSQLNVEPLYFCLLRDPLSRAYSMYNYILSNNSKHEDTHGKIKSRSFFEYLRSYELEDCWIIRSLTQIHDNKIIDESDFEQSCSFLDLVKIDDIKNVDALLNDVFEKTYSINMDFLKTHLSKNIDTRNKTFSAEKDKISISCLDEETKIKYLDRTQYDYKIYNKYIK
jgi:hypothetical protein